MWNDRLRSVTAKSRRFWVDNRSFASEPEQRHYSTQILSGERIRLLYQCRPPDHTAVSRAYGPMLDRPHGLRPAMSWLASSPTLGPTCNTQCMERLPLPAALTDFGTRHIIPWSLFGIDPRSACAAEAARHWGNPTARQTPPVTLRHHLLGGGLTGPNFL